jgi:cytochrome b561
MSFGEREALTSLFTTLIVVAIFLVTLSGQHAEGIFSGPEALKLWARLVLKLSAVSIGIAIAVTIVVHIVYSIVTGEKSVDQRDERDSEIERRAITWSWYILSFGILGVIIDLAVGASAFRAMNLILALCALAETFKDLFKIWHYRRGA